MKHVGGILTAVALSLSLNAPALVAKGLRQTRRDISSETIVRDPQQTPFFTLLPQNAQEVAQLNSAKEFMQMSNLATFVGVDKQKLTVNRYDGLRGIVECSKHGIDKSGVASRVQASKTLAYNDGVKTPLQYGKGGRAGSAVDGKLSRLAQANSSEEAYEGPTVATMYAERSPIMLDAKKVDDVETFVNYFAQTLVDNPALGAITDSNTARPLMLLTVRKDLFLQGVPAEAVTQLQKWFTVTTLAEAEVNAYFAEAGQRVIDLAGTFGSDGLVEVGVPLKQGMWSDFSKQFQNFDWKRFVRKGVNSVSEKALDFAVPAAVFAVVWKTITKLMNRRGGVKLSEDNIKRLFKESMKARARPAATFASAYTVDRAPRRATTAPSVPARLGRDGSDSDDNTSPTDPIAHAEDRVKNAEATLEAAKKGDDDGKKVRAHINLCEAEEAFQQVKAQMDAGLAALTPSWTTRGCLKAVGVMNKVPYMETVNGMIHASDMRRRATTVAALAVFFVNNLLPVIQKRGSIDKMFTWTALKEMGTRFFGNFYGRKMTDDDTKTLRTTRTAAQWVALIALIQVGAGKHPAPAPGAAHPV